MLAIIYGSTTGNTADIAVDIQANLGKSEVDLFDIKDTDLGIIDAYDQLIFAIPTWDYGEVQEDWDEVWDAIDEYDFSGKTVAFVGLGDQLGYAEWFVDAMGMLHDKIVARGARAVGYWPTEGYEYDSSKAETKDGKHFVGLAIDEDTQRDETPARLQAWCDQIRTEMALDS